MGPVVWWWRMWSGVIDPERERELTDAQGRAEAETARADALAAALADKDGEIAGLQKRISDADAELERMHAQLVEVDGGAAELRARVDELSGAQSEADRLRGQAEQADTLREEANRLRERMQELEAQLAQRDAQAQQDTEAEAQQDSDAQQDTEAEAQQDSDAPPDVSEGTQVLGRRVALDDLTVVEGIGPKIADLLDAAGISTWRALADADDATLRGVLDEAGPRYRVHDPSNWSRQAELLARGQWRQFADLVADLRAARTG